MAKAASSSKPPKATQSIPLCNNIVASPEKEISSTLVGNLFFLILYGVTCIALGYQLHIIRPSIDQSLHVFNEIIARSFTGNVAQVEPVNFHPCYAVLDKYLSDEHDQLGLHGVCLVEHAGSLHVSVHKDLRRSKLLMFTISSTASLKELRASFDDLVCT